MAVLPRKSSATKTILAAGNYSAGDALSESATDNAGTAFEFAGIAPRHGFPFTLRAAQQQCSEDAVAARIRWHLFNQNPLAAEVEMDDNVAFSIKTAAGAAKYVGFIDMPALADLGTIPSAGQATQLDMMVDPANGDTLWAVPQTLDDEANESGSMTLSLTLFATET